MSSLEGSFAALRISPGGSDAAKTPQVQLPPPPPNLSRTFLTYSLEGSFDCAQDFGWRAVWTKVLTYSSRPQNGSSLDAA